MTEEADYFIDTSYENSDGYRLAYLTNPDASDKTKFQPVYLAPPNYEALQAQNKELVEYAGKLRQHLQNICGNRCNAENNPCEARDALAIPLPAAMRQGLK